MVSLMSSLLNSLSLDKLIWGLGHRFSLVICSGLDASFYKVWISSSFTSDFFFNSAFPFIEELPPQTIHPVCHPKQYAEEAY